MTRALVTGASGFIGRHLTAVLVARGDEVTALVRRTSQTAPLESQGVRLVYGDVTDPQSVVAAVAGQAVVYHLAGLTRSLHARELYQVNEEGVRHVAAACAQQAEPPVLVVVSSLAAAGPAPGDRLRTEQDPPCPVSHYGRSKRAGEQAAEAFADQVPITIVRPPIVFGEGDRATLAMFKSVARSGLHLVPGLVPREFSLIHADDLAQLLILAAERGSRLAPPTDASQKPSDSGYYFAACDEHPTYDRLGHLIGESLGRRRTLTIPCTRLTVHLVGAVGDLIGRARGRPVVLNLDKAREATAGAWVCSPDRAREELGFSTEVPLATRLRQTAEWYREHGWL